MAVTIPENYWSGTRHLELGIPWFVPKAILRMDQLLEKHFKVLEFGAGGSTVFFTDRCREVYTIEHNSRWIGSVRQRLEEKGHTLSLKVTKDIVWATMTPNQEGLAHTSITQAENSEQYQKVIETLPDADFDCILFDSDCDKITRRELGEWALRKLKPNGIVIVDNYYRPENIIDALSQDWVCEDYTDIHWWGNGTRIAYKPTRNTPSPICLTARHPSHGGTSHHAGNPALAMPLDSQPLRHGLEGSEPLGPTETSQPRKVANMLNMIVLRKQRWFGHS